MLAKIKSKNLTNHLVSISYISPRKSDDIWLISNFEKVNALHHHLHSTFQPNNFIIPHNQIDEIKHFLCSSILLTLPKKHIRPSEVKFIFHKSTSHKTSGYDLITSEMSSQLPKAILFLTHIYNSMIRITYFPLLWKFLIIIMILKPGKSPNSPSSYRPISLIPFFSAIYEKLMLKCLLPIIDANCPDN